MDSGSGNPKLGVYGIHLEPFIWNPLIMKNLNTEESV